MAINIVEEIIIPEVPRIIDSQQIYVYVPKASYVSAGIASFNQEHFFIEGDEVNLNMEMVNEMLSWRDGVLEQNNLYKLKFFIGTWEEISEVEQDDNTIYIPTDPMPDIEELMYRISVLENKLANCDCGD